MNETYPAATWRLLYSPPADGATNMAVDEAILLAVAAGEAPPTLRFFAWEPPCLSLGTAQKSGDADLALLRQHGYDVVRRPTGGRAILHVDELTYSVIAPQDEPRVSGDIVTSYRRLSGGLMRGLQQLGLRVQSAAQADNVAQHDHGPVCFEVPSNYEITVNGKKLIGSAQMRRRDVVLQHGTLPLTGDIARICNGLSFPDENAREEAQRRVRERALTLAEALGKEVAWQTASEAMTAGFGAALNLSFAVGTLTAHEQQTARRLRAEKYANDEWTLSRGRRKRALDRGS